jgi:hypothetical protein
MTDYIKYEVTVYEDGTKSWRLNGKRHREDGPAIEYSGGAIGAKFWCLNDELHREDGPAIEYADGDKCWYLNGQRLTEEEHRVRMYPTVEMTMAEINEALGKNVKVVK